jgi:hypothetical protein
VDTLFPKNIENEGQIWEDSAEHMKLGNIVMYTIATQFYTRVFISKPIITQKLETDAE